MKGYRTILFDLDGTLLDTLADLEVSVNYMLKEMGYPLRKKEEVRSFLGNGVRHLDQVTSAVWLSASVLPPRKLTSGQTPSQPALASWKSRPLCLQSERL